MSQEPAKKKTWVKAVSKTGHAVGDMVIQAPAKAVNKVTHGMLRKRRATNHRAPAVDNLTEPELKESHSVTPEPRVVSFSDTKDEVSREEDIITVSPHVEFWASDAVLLAIVSSMLALYPTWQYVHSRRTSSNDTNGDVPMGTVLVWLIVAFCWGRLEKSVNGMSTVWKTRQAEKEIPACVDQHVDSERSTKSDVSRGHRILSSMYRLQNKRLSFQLRRPEIFSALNLNRGESERWRWEFSIDPTKIKNKNTNPNDLLEYIRKSKYVGAVKSTELTETSDGMGTFDLPEADSINIPDVEPLFRLRGMDVFLTDEAETALASHPWLVQQGLRDVPTAVVNILTVWGNVLLYFELPAWVQNFTSSLEEEDGDKEQVSAFKKFLRSSDDYRNDRLHMIPSVVEAPRSVKMVAPGKKEYKLHNPSFLPVGWKFTDREVSQGRTLCPVVECELDCLSSRAIRGMSGIVKRNMVKLVIDSAVVLRAPPGANDEPLCCLGIWRFDHVDVSSCPAFPDRYEHEAERQGIELDELRASVLRKSMKVGSKD